MSRKICTSGYILLGTILVLMAFLNTCKKALLTAPGSATLVVTVNPSTIPLGGEAMVRVVGYKASGTLLPDGTKIFFSTDIGSIEPVKETQSGVAEALFQSNDNRSGLATITVTSGNAQTTPDTVTITIGSSALYSLSMSADPSTLPHGGGLAAIRVMAYDEAQNPLPNIPVILTTDAGELNSKGNTITTDANGAAEDLLNTTRTAEVTASSGEISATLTVTVENNEAPTASFEYSPESPKVDEKVYFNASGSSDPDGTIVSYEWDFGDGRSATGQKTNHRYKQTGTYTVVLVVRDDTGSAASASRSIPISTGDGPTASFEYSPAEPRVNEDVYFNASASSDPDGTIESFEWDFGDGSTGTGETITHRYSGAGAYNVVLLVTDNSGNTDSTGQTVTIGDNESPVASFIYSPTNPAVNEDIYFNASDSYDPDGTIASYEWDFGDGTTGSGQTITHQYSRSDTYKVVLVVTDNSGSSGSTNQTIAVGDNENPVASFIYSPTDPAVNDEIYFNASDSYDPDGTIVAYEWDFGDTATGSGQTFTHQYGSQGTYTVLLLVRDNSGNSASTSKTVTVSAGQSPSAAFVYSPANPFTGDTVYFDASESSDSDGTIVSFEWNFGDGSTGSGETTTHQYQSEGTFTVVLYITDDDGNTSSASKNIPVTDNQAPGASFVYSPANPVTNQDVYFNASGSSDPDGTITAWAWDFGDGSTGSGETIAHQYTSTGTYTVVLVVTDDSGNSSSTSKTVTVN